MTMLKHYSFLKYSYENVFFMRSSAIHYKYF